MMNKPANNSRQAVATYIGEYLDPQGELTSDDDAATVVENLDAVYAEDGGCGVTVEQMAEYLESLPA